MSDKMRPIPFPQLMEWILKEKENCNTVFGVQRPFIKSDSKTLSLFREKLETPFGPAAGPHTQLAQNIIASYYAGSRFFELKTVQIIDGEDLPVSKPCINANDECYNVEWSTELRVQDAFDEYLKAWFVLKVISKEFGLGEPDGFMFNMSVGYDFEGICSPKIDNYIEGMKNASQTDIFKECKQYLLQNISQFKNIDAAYIESIPARICDSITLSTLHGCPPSEIERISSYLIEKKGLNTFIKCNPTMLGYDTAREILNKMGYDYIEFDDHHFKNDLQFEDAVPMFQRLQELADKNGVSFGIKLTNTFPVKVAHGELPGEEMYMSGRSLYALTLCLASRISKEFHGKLRISYSGGADAHNIDKIFQLGIWPITLATTLLKPGGYQRLLQMAETLNQCEYTAFSQIDVEGLSKLAEEALLDKHHTKPVKPLPSRKMSQKVPLTDCFVAPCKEGCPIHQDIPAYVNLVGEGRYLEALQVITDKNPLPFITGTICSHRCMSKCTRNFYEESVQIRSAKLEAAEHAFEDLLLQSHKSESQSTTKVAIIGGGPAGLSAAYFLGKNGIDTTIFERTNSLGGIVRHIIPEFRITNGAIDNDIRLIESMGIKVELNSEISSIEELKQKGFDTILIATGAWKHSPLKMDGESIDVLDFLSQFKTAPEKLQLGKSVAVIGGGNTAMDAARAAKKVAGVEQVRLVYRRTKCYMPADEEELLLALQDGVEFCELLAPDSFKDGTLTCHKMALGEADSSGRRSPIETDETVQIPVDTVIAAIGEKIDTDFFQNNGISVNEKGRVAIDDSTFQTNIAGVYVAGDSLRGPATVVEAIADATRFAKLVIENETAFAEKVLNGFHHTESVVREKRGILKKAAPSVKESERCLECSTVCECCVDVCPNRANVAISVPGNPMKQIIHIDGMCNECGNCATFCPYDSKPYRDKFTLFRSEADFDDSQNQGFLLVDKEARKFKVRLDGETHMVTLGQNDSALPAELENIITTAYTQYPYLFY